MILLLINLMTTLLTRSPMASLQINKNHSLIQTQTSIHYLNPRLIHYNPIIFNFTHQHVCSNWILDTGITYHVCHLVKIQRDQIRLANGASINVLFSCTVSLNNNFYLTNVLDITQFSTDLISTLKMIGTINLHKDLYMLTPLTQNLLILVLGLFLIQVNILFLKVIFSIIVQTILGMTLLLTSIKNFLYKT